MIFKFAGPPAVVPDEIKALEGEDAHDTMPGMQRLNAPMGSQQLALLDANKSKLNPEDDPVKRRAILKRCVETLRISQEITKRFFVASESEDKDYLTYQEFLTGFTLRADDMSRQLFDLFDYKKTDQIEFRDICFAILSLLAKTKEEKIKFAFMIYDFDQDGFLNQKELGRLLKSSYVAARDDQVSAKAGAILRQADVNKDNNLSFGSSLMLHLNERIFVMDCLNSSCFYFVFAEEISSIDKRYPNLLFPAFQSI
jgi:Ca2+-binding EF-hand superfamily protein